MIHQQVRKSGNSFVVTIPKSEMERLNIREGQTVALDITPMELTPVLRSEIVQIMDEIREDSAPVMRFLRDK